MDISELKPADERVIEITHPGTGDPIGVRVSLMSITDARMVKIKRKIQDERLRLEARGKNFKADDIEENRNELSFRAMTGWEWYDGANFKGDKNPVFNRATVDTVLTELPWFRDQIEEGVSDEKSFFTTSKLG